LANELIINASLPEIRIALMEDGDIQELFIEREADKGIVGNIYKGKVTRVLPGMQAAFIDIGLEKAAFLYVDDIVVHTKEWQEDEGVNREDEVEGAEDDLEDVPVVEDEFSEEEPQEMGEDPGAIPEGAQTRPLKRKGSQTQTNARRQRDRRIRPKNSTRPARQTQQIQDLIQVDQEILVQVAKDPISSKGARLTCHISLPGRHLVCMPTIDHVGVSRRIERDEERRRLRDFVDKTRPKGLGFIVRTASGKNHAEKHMQQDIDYLSKLWSEIQERASEASAPALIYEDLNPVLRAVRDWVTEDIDRLVVDSKPYYQEILHFVSHFMPSMRQRVELYQGDIPIFDTYGISTQLSRALERKVWLKSGGYIVIDQAEALVAIDVNTGKFVGKKNLEDTIIKTNLEAVQEIAYQLRLRNCGGIIIIDLIDMDREENRHRVYRALEEALSKDRARPSILKISELGLVEMTRKRTRDTIVRALCEVCTHCEGKGYIKSRSTVAFEVMREMERAIHERDASKILVQAHPTVIDMLAIREKDTLDRLEERAHKSIDLQAVQDFHPEQFEVSLDRASPKPAFRKDYGRFEKTSRPQRPKRPQRDKPHHQRAESPEVSGQKQAKTPGSAVAKPHLHSPKPSQASVKPATQVNMASTSQDPHEEEDRLAFLRAQAAQDAALAKLGGNNGPAPSVRKEQKPGFRPHQHAHHHNKRRGRRPFQKGVRKSPGNGDDSSGV
jgi:ribonuclease G